MAGQKLARISNVVSMASGLTGGQEMDHLSEYPCLWDAGKVSGAVEFLWLKPLTLPAISST